MTEDQFAEYREMEFMRSRIPALDALSTLVPDGQEEDAQVRQAISVKGCSRWCPTEDGHEVLIPYEGQEFEVSRFAIKKGAWDHEHCKVCSADIPSMTLCWVTKSGPFVVLCEECYGEMKER
jgi:hypothetical protein